MIFFFGGLSQIVVVVVFPFSYDVFLGGKGKSRK